MSASEHVAVHAAPPALQAWCRCVVVHRVDLGEVATSIQASTWASLNVVVSGTVHGSGGPLPQRFMTMPFSEPYETHTTGPLLASCLVLQPWALQSLLGQSVQPCQRLPADVACWSSGSIDGLCDHLAKVCRQGDPTNLWAALQAHEVVARLKWPALAWQALATGGVRAAASALRCSPRHYLRRFRSTMGLAPATWLRIRRWEDALLALAEPEGQPLAELSQDHGFADQAHLARDTRTLAGQTPSGLRIRLQDGHLPWSLWPARVRFVQDDDAVCP